MHIIDFETAKSLSEKLNIKTWNQCYYLYAKDDKKIIDWSSMEADYYLKDDNRFYAAPFIQEVIEFLERKYKWSIYITPRFDGFDNAQIDTYFEIYKTGYSGGKDYASDLHVGNRYESANRAIRETIDLIINEKINSKYAKD